MLEVIDIDITSEFTSFSTTLDSVVDDTHNDTGEYLEWDYNDAGLSGGRSAYKITLRNNDSSNQMEIVALKNGSNIEFSNMKLRNFNNTFYKNNNNEDGTLNIIFTRLFQRLTSGTHGTFLCINQTQNDDQRIFICKGKDKSNHIKSLAFVDDMGHVYAQKGTEISDDNDSEEDGVDVYMPKYLLNTWLDENTEFNAKLQGLPRKEQPDFMGKYAIFQKRKNMLTANQFKDIFLQVGMLSEMFGGFNDNTLKDLYQFFV